MKLFLTTIFPLFLEKVFWSYLKASMENGKFYLGCQGRKILYQCWNLIKTKNHHLRSNIRLSSPAHANFFYYHFSSFSWKSYLKLPKSFLEKWNILPGMPRQKNPGSVLKPNQNKKSAWRKYNSIIGSPSQHMWNFF